MAAFVAAAPTARHDGPVTSDADPTDGTSLATERWRDDAGVVAVLMSVDGGGHTWPSALVPPPPNYGVVSHEFDASAVAVAFLTTGDVPG